MATGHGGGSARVSLWQNGLPLVLRQRDDTGVMRALVGVADAQLQARYADITAAFTVWNPDTCAARWLPVIARGRGWSLDASMPVALQRKVVRVLVSLYRQKGTLPGMVNAVRLFLGEEARVRAAWAGAWRLGKAHLGRYSVSFTATAGQTAFDASTVDTAWRCTPHVSRVRVWRNGTELAAHHFLPVDRTTVWLTTQGTTIVARGGETSLSLGFSYTPGRNALVVTRNGRRIDSPTHWTEPSGAGPHSSITLTGTATQGTIYVVHSRDGLTGVTAGDVVRVSTDDLAVTRAAPPLVNVPSDYGFMLYVEVPRPLTLVEHNALTEVLRIMKPARMFLDLDGRDDSRLWWRLGAQQLARGTRLAPPR